MEKAFPGVRHIRDGKSIIKFHRGSSQQSPGVIDVVLTTSIEPASVNSLKNDPTDVNNHPLVDAAADVVLDTLKVGQPTKVRLVQQIATQASRKTRKPEVEQRFISPLDPKDQEPVRSSPDIYQAYGKAISHTHVENNRNELSAELKGPFLQKMEAMFAARNAELQDAMDAKHEEVQAIIANNTAAIGSRVQAVLTQTYELHEYPIPRLFVVLPQDPSVWNTLNPFANKFRLYFLCECGEHTKSINSKTGIPHHIHFAKHEGYEIARPSEFFEQYGSYVLTILKMLKYSITVTGIVMPSFSQLLNPDVLGQTITRSYRTGREQGGFEGADLRKLETFLRATDGNKVLGDLYRTVTDEGHVKWVCIDHYRENYNRTSVETFRRAVESLGGYFDENTGLVQVKLGSRAAAKQFYSALGYARSVRELNIVLDWNCTAADIQLLEDALTKSAVMVLHLDVQRFLPSFTDKLSSIQTQYQALGRILNPLNMRSIHIVLPVDLIKLSNFTPKRPPHLRKLSFEMAIVTNIRVHTEMLETGSTVTSTYLYTSSIKSSEVQALSKALTTSLILNTLDLKGKSIEPYVAQALSEALKTNLTLITLNLYSNSIGDNGARALSEALRTNSTLRTLDLGWNSIETNGAQALSEAFKSNWTLTSLSLGGNAIGDSADQALSTMLKRNLSRMR
ncbi:hypothetical protein BGZ70_008620 [Mortierella alpina]|uniref:RNI-like protein n=1 Tax=Mortierella alpina TaxID=64518 RepID=A0A9P6J375_MORAP|nr:hypothetical protein BGZ70_008620 [Mortierella alpina]